MNSFTIRQNAKINITLDVFEKNGEFHPIKSFCVPIDLKDKITVKKRKDQKITLTEKGIKTNVLPEQNNAYKAAELFIKEKGTLGVDIIVDKKIPLSSGLGGSSADISGVILCMEKLFNKSAKDLLAKLGSDTTFTYYNKPAVISGKGEEIEFIIVEFSYYVLIITDKTGISAKECYEKFDELNSETAPCTEKAIELIKNKGPFINVIKNDLENSAISILPTLKEKIKDLESVGALKAQVTGSGSAVYGIFSDKKLFLKATKKLKQKYKNYLIKAKC